MSELSIDNELLIDHVLSIDNVLKPIVEDPGQPYLMIDLYPLDFDKASTPQIDDPPWERLLADPRIMGVWLKATDGAKWAQAYEQWFVRNFVRLIQLIGERRGISAMLGGYSFLQLTQDGVLQADYAWRIATAAGYKPGIDMAWVLDIESGNEHHPNQKATNPQIIECGHKFTERWESLSGVNPILYGRGFMRDRGIVNNFGCRRASNPSYTRTMVTNGLIPPFKLEDIVEWQYGGDGVGNNNAHHLPLKIAGCAIDLSVAINGNQAPTLQGSIARLK